MRSTTPTVYWIGHTGRLAWYNKYAMARIALRHGIPMEQLSFRDAPDMGIPAEVESDLRGCHAVVVVEWEGRRCSLILDVAEGFFFVTPAMQHVDRYLCSAYHPVLFQQRQFPDPYPWQSEEALTTLRTRFDSTLESCGAWFDRIEPFVPMPMSLHFPAHRAHLGPWLKTRIYSKTMTRGPRTITADDTEHKLFDARYQLVESYRALPLRFDVVVRDTFWASPRHRAQLHGVLQGIADDHAIVRELREVDDEYDRMWLRGQLSPEQWLNVERLLEPHGSFNEPFEQMVASSRLNTYAVGKHWGWREICFLSMACGMPILMDRPQFMPYCGLDDFEIWFTEGDWSEVPSLLDSMTDSRWSEIRARNQAAFDRRFAPDAVGSHILRTALNQLGATAEETAWLNG